MNRPDDPELQRIEALLRAIDPGREAARELSAKRRGRVLWSWRHPLLAWCIRHHVALSVTVAAMAVAALAAWMVCVQIAFREAQEVPEPVSKPVRVLSAPGPVEQSP